MIDRSFWFTKKSKQFLKQVDTFYYSVKLQEDFTRESADWRVKKLREYISDLKTGNDNTLVADIKDYAMFYRHGRFADFYNFRLEYPECFDFFFAPVVATPIGDNAPMPEIVVQIRSRLLWELGVTEAYNFTLGFVTAFCEHFNLHIAEIKENRIDYACHTNYIQSPEKFFTRKRLDDMTISSFRDRQMHDRLYPGRSELDYIAYGKRGQKCFLRIYLKTKEVVEQGYKGFFIRLWRDQGMISEYDRYVLEECYKQKSWSYVPVARLQFAVAQMYDEMDPEDLSRAVDLLGVEVRSYDLESIRDLASKYTPDLTVILNVEFQVMRAMSRSFELISMGDQGKSSRIYDLFANYSLIYEYLTRKTFRLVKPDPTETNRSRLKDCEFWSRLRGAKTMELLKTMDLKLLRSYNSQLSLDVRKIRAAHALSSFGYALDHDENNSIINNAADLLAMLNDNDLFNITNYKHKLAGRNMEVIPPEQDRFRSLQWYYAAYDPDSGDYY